MVFCAFVTWIGPWTGATIWIKLSAVSMTCTELYTPLLPDRIDIDIDMVVVHVH